MCGKIKRSKIINDNIRERVGIEPIVEMVVETRLSLFGYAERRPIDYIPEE